MVFDVEQSFTRRNVKGIHGLGLFTFTERSVR